MDELANKWLDRIVANDKHYQAWAKRYKVAACEEYYEGFQWAQDDSDGYVMNMFYSTIETKLPSLVFENPIYRIAPKINDVSTDPEIAFQAALNLEDAVNTWTTDDSNHFGEEAELAIIDAFFRFGVLEIGYSADWIDNPVLQKPAFKADYQNNFTSIKNFVKRFPPKVPENEQIYIKQIPAKRFRVSTTNGKYISQCDWCAYYELARIEDLRASKNLKNTDELEFSSFYNTELGDNLERNDENIRLARTSMNGYTLIWKIWDNRLKRKLIIADDQSVVLYDKPFQRLPFVDLRFRRRGKGDFLPLPPTFNWIPPQNEINESREMQKVHRRRFKRLYWYLEGVEYDEINKVINGPDGGLIKLPRADAIGAIPNADLGASATLSMQVSKDDFNIITGTTSEQRGEADRTTATQAGITNQRAQIRESRERGIVANFYRRIAREVIWIFRNKFVNPMQVDTTENSEEFLQPMEDKKTKRTLNPITDFGDEELEFDVTISIDTFSPVANDVEKAKFLEFLQLLNAFPQFALSPILVRELAFRVGYRNEKVIKEFQRMAQLQMIGMVSQGLQGQTGPQGPSTKQKQMQPPNAQQMGNQLKGQGVIQ